jgi:N-acetylglucosaminyl-diphospho-decaprenol L-rhamnosyltransferase
MTPSVHIIVVNWNTGDCLRSCLSSIAFADREGVSISRVTVVDNASRDGSADGLQDLPLPLEVLRNNHNVGFAAACNQGAAGSTADHLLFLNPDTRLFPDTLTVTTRFMESERAAGVGICGVSVVDGAGRPTISCSRFPTLRVMLGKLTRLHRVAPSVFPSHHLSPAELRQSRFVDQVIGAFYLVRRELFQRLGGFDTRFFLYFEEVDLALRASRRGARSYFLREAQVLHAENVSTSRAPAARLYHSLRSRFLFAYTYWPRWQAHALVALTLTVELTGRLAGAAFSRDGLRLRETLSAYRALVTERLPPRAGHAAPPLDGPWLGNLRPKAARRRSRRRPARRSDL